MRILSDSLSHLSCCTNCSSYSLCWCRSSNSFLMISISYSFSSSFYKSFTCSLNSLFSSSSYSLRRASYSSYWSWSSSILPITCSSDFSSWLLITVVFTFYWDFCNYCIAFFYYCYIFLVASCYITSESIMS